MLSIPINKSPCHQFSYAYGSTGSTTGASGVPSAGGPHSADDYSRRHAPGPVYHLNPEHLNTLSPPSTIETGTNSLDDILKPPSKQLFFEFKFFEKPREYEVVLFLKT